MYQITISAEEIGALPLASFPGKIQVVDKLDDSFYQAVRYLKKQKVLGFDTETRPCFSPGKAAIGSRSGTRETIRLCRLLKTP